MKIFKSPLLFLAFCFIFTTCYLSISSHAQMNPGSELTEGFREFKWGMPVSELPDTYKEEFVTSSLKEHFDERDFVKKDRDAEGNMESGLYTLEVRLVFSHDKFGGAKIQFFYDDRETVTKVMLERFGNNAKIEKGTDSITYKWTGAKTFMNLTVSRKSEHIFMTILNTPTLGEAIKLRKQKEKEEEDKIKNLSKERF